MRRLWKRIAPVAVCLLAAPAWCVEAPVSADTYVVSNTGNSYGTQATLNVTSNSGTGVQSAGLVRFDLAALPPGLQAADVNHARLTLYINKVVTAGTVNVERHSGRHVSPALKESAFALQPTNPLTGNQT